MLSLLFLPVRLLFGIVCAVLWLPFHVLRLVLTLVGTIVVLPILLLLMAVGLLFAGLKLLVELVLLGLFVWVVLRLVARPASAW